MGGTPVSCELAADLGPRSLPKYDLVLIEGIACTIKATNVRCAMRERRSVAPQAQEASTKAPPYRLFMLHGGVISAKISDKSQFWWTRSA